MKQFKRRPGLCACGQHWKRENQGNCYECHAKAQADYRQKAATYKRAYYRPAAIIERMKHAQAKG